MAERIVIDPLTRIEGHLRIEAQVDGGKVHDAWSSCTMWRGIETILKGRDPRDAWIITQRLCGVCTTVHAVTSVRAVEDALKIRVPENAELIRNLIAGLQMVQDHVIHFYHLHALDWVDLVSALGADPEKTSSLAQSISPYEKSSASYFRGVQGRLKTFVASGQLGPFDNAYWGHPAYKLPPEANLMAVAHYLEALTWQREVIKGHAILGGKNPHLQTYVVGGMALPLDPQSQHAFNMGSIATLRGLFAQAKKFVDEVYIPDVLAVAGFYKEWAGYGATAGNFLSLGEYLPRGIILGADLGKVHPFDASKITESVARAWYSERWGVTAHPTRVETVAEYSGPTPPYEHLDVDRKYSWLKSPRYDGKVMEVGPLARMLVAYAGGHERTKALVGHVLGALGVGPAALFSTLGRVAARAIETVIAAEQLGVWLEKLAQNIGHGDLEVQNAEKWKPETWPEEAEGMGCHEAPRGTLTHFVRIVKGKIARYQCVVPSTWNAGPRDEKDQRGPYETALLGTPIADPERPLEILRTVHSFDPCMACAAHVFDRRGARLATVEAMP